ncbi:MAG: phage tail protein [Proteobacteria bacterium]|nr:phage tail protein [Pseudomonadota bacterium]
MSNLFSVDINGVDNISAIIADMKATEKHALIASMRSLNKTALWLRTQATRKISKNKRITQKIIRQRLRVLKASRSQLKSHVLASLGGVTATKVGKPRQTRTGAKVKQYNFPGAFIATMPSGHTGIYKRKRKTRLPIRELSIPLEPESSDIIESFLDNGVKERFETIFRRELKFLVQR